MKPTPLNPFITEGYRGNHYFCDREEETKTLIEALYSGRNVTVISPRRMGKSGLIHHAFARMRNEDPEIRCYYIDIFHTHSLKDFINVFASAVFGTLENSIEKLYNKVVGIFKRCRPVITPDVVTGAPQLTLNIDPGQEEYTLEEIFRYLNASGKRVAIAFDEFQQIAEYPEKGVEALLRSFIQLTDNVSFVFAGSKKHIMQQMFALPSRPFYQSTQTMVLRPIPLPTYMEFAIHLFEEYGKRLQPEAFRYMYETVYGHTWYLQYWLSRLFDSVSETADIDNARQVLTTILNEEDDNFYMYSRLITDAQRRVIAAIASGNDFRTPITQEMVSRFNLPAPSTVRSCIKVLLEKEMILEEREVYTVYNRFFMLWLRMVSKE